jgi:putative transposase
MPRQRRIEVPGGFFHVTSRGCNRCPIYDGDASRELHLALLGQTVHQFAWTCHAYCQMDNHFHLLLQTPNANLSAGMQFLNGAYAQAFNRHGDRSGHLFQGRFHSVIIRWDGQLWEAERYTVLNRVRARACARAADWPWSSYPAAAGLAPRPPFLTVETTLARFGDPADSRTRARYRGFIADGVAEKTLRGALSRYENCGRDLPGATAGAR